jgi:holo-[acyl-carrier protein] synthase
MILGIGCDIVEVSRIESGIKRLGRPFLEHILSPGELKVYDEKTGQNSSRALYFVAGRWAAKEAFSKAMRTGVRPPVVLRDISVLNDGLGAPYFEFHGEIGNIVSEQKLRFFVSISDTKALSMASVVCERI